MTDSREIVNSFDVLRPVKLVARGGETAALSVVIPTSDYGWKLAATPERVLSRPYVDAATEGIVFAAKRYGGAACSVARPYRIAIIVAGRVYRVCLKTFKVSFG